MADLGWFLAGLALRVGFIVSVILVIGSATGWAIDWTAFSAFLSGYVMGRLEGYLP